MIFKKRAPVPQPLGVALDELESVLRNTNLQPSRVGDSLIVKHESLVTYIRVSAPAIEPGETTRARAVVRIATDITHRAAAMGAMGRIPDFGPRQTCLLA